MPVIDILPCRRSVFYAVLPRCLLYECCQTHNQPFLCVAQHFFSNTGEFSRLSSHTTIWGFVLGCHAACTTFAGLAVCRTLLGVFESYVAPILVLIIAMWYKKEQQGRRSSSVCVPARFAREGETVHRCRESGRFDESGGESEWNAELRLKEGASLRDIRGPPRLLVLPSNASFFHSKRRYLRTSQAHY